MHATVDNITLQPAAVELTFQIAPARQPDAIVARKTMKLLVPPGGIKQDVALAIRHPQPWTPDAPNLYVARVVVNQDGQPADEESVRFGLREFTVRNGRFELNGKPLFIKAGFGEGQYPSTLGHPKNPDIVRREIQLAKEAGFNLLRPWRMPPAPLTLDLADEMGMLIIGAPPIECMNQWPALTPPLERRWTREMEQMILRDRNHPAIICWETGNEVVRRSLYLLRHKVSLAARRLFPTRLVIDESGGRSWSYGGDSGRHNKNANYDGITFARGPHIYLPGSTTPVPIEDHHLYLPAPVNEKDYQKLATLGTAGGLTFVSEVGYGGWPDMAADVARYHRKGNPKTPDYRFHEHLLASLEKVMTAHKLGELFPDVPALCRASQQIQADGNTQLKRGRGTARPSGFTRYSQRSRSSSSAEALYSRA